MLLMRSGSKFLCVILALMASRGVVWMPPEMPARACEKNPVIFCRAPQRSVRGLRDRSGEPLKSGRLALLEASRIPLWFPLHRLPSIVDATPPPPPHHHRSLPTGCPRRPARHPSRRRTQQHPPLHVAASSAATPRQLPSTFQQRPPHPTLAVAAPIHSAAAASYETDATKQTPPQPCRKLIIVQ